MPVSADALWNSVCIRNCCATPISEGESTDCCHTHGNGGLGLESTPFLRVRSTPRHFARRPKLGLIQQDQEAGRQAKASPSCCPSHLFSTPVLCLSLSHSC